jgi:hypothetical protein
MSLRIVSLAAACHGERKRRAADKIVADCMRIHRWLIPVAALAAILPLAWWGPSCGKDFDFHLQSWLDVAAQMRHGVVLPRWNFLSAYNAGEPRYIFYPPLSWMLGGSLTLALPFAWVPLAVSWLALCVAGFSFRRLVCGWASPFAATTAACVYLANPFILFSIAARGAFGEIFAAALMPLLMEALVREEPSVLALGLPLAGIWLSNVPGGVMAAYLYLALALAGMTAHRRNPWTRLCTYVAGAALAVALDAFFLLPAVHQRSLIHAGEPFIFPLRPTDSLFFARVLQGDGDAFLIRVGQLAAAMACVTFLLLGVDWLRTRQAPRRRIAAITAAMVVVVCFMLTAPAAVLWRALPGLYILQFPWRLLLLMAMCLAIAWALAFAKMPAPPWRTAAASLAIVSALSIGAFHLYIERCIAQENPLGVQEQLTLLHHSPEPIDEYVAAGADPERMRPDNPSFWFASDPLAYAVGTTPNPASTVPGAAMPAVPGQARLSETPLAFSVNAARAGFVVVNLQAYPNWRVTRNGEAMAALPVRPDGLLVVPIDAGESRIAIRWRHGWDEWVGGVMSVLAAAGCCVAGWRRRWTSVRLATQPDSRFSGE